MPLSIFKQTQNTAVSILKKQPALASSRAPSQAIRVPLTPQSLVLPQKTWRWGPEGYGAVLLVNCDRDSVVSAGPDLTNSQLATLDGV